MTMFPQNRPKARTPVRRQTVPSRVAFLLFDGFQILDAAGPLAAFEIAGRYCEGAYRLDVIAAEGGAVASSSAATIGAGAFRTATYDTLIVAGGDGTRTAFRDERILKFVRKVATRARRVTSVCSGAFILAAAGLLDGRRATTHWSRTAEFARRFPEVRVEPDRIYVKDGPVWTSAGITAGIDLARASPPATIRCQWSRTKAPAPIVAPTNSPPRPRPRSRRADSAVAIAAGDFKRGERPGRRGESGSRRKAGSKRRGTACTATACRPLGRL